MECAEKKHSQTKVISYQKLNFHCVHTPTPHPAELFSYELPGLRSSSGGLTVYEIELA